MIHVLTLVKVKNSSCSASLLPKKQNILIYQGLIFVLSLNIVFKGVYAYFHMVVLWV